jgi:hypothetical protein
MGRSPNVGRWRNGYRVRCTSVDRNQWHVVNVLQQAGDAVTTDWTSDCGRVRLVCAAPAPARAETGVLI